MANEDTFRFAGESFRKNHIPNNLEEWLKQYCSERKYYKSHVGSDGKPKTSDFKKNDYYLINKELRKKYEQRN